VYRSPGSGADVTYILFGEAKVEEMSPALSPAMQAAAMQQFQRSAAGGGRGGAPAGGKGGGAGGEDEEGDEDAPGLEGEGRGASKSNTDGVEEKDIELVMTQADCSRERAIAALKKHDSDIVNSIMELTNA
jgi:nascent polypeptide-associated complex subunit alpha